MTENYKRVYYKMSYYPPYKSSSSNIKFKNIFAKGYTPYWSKEIFIVNKINDTVLYTYNIKDLNDEEIVSSFYGRELQKSIL